MNLQLTSHHKAYLNDLDLASEYIVRLTDGFLSENSLEQAFFLQEEASIAQTALRGLQMLEDKFRSILKGGLEQLSNQLIRPRLRPLILECYKDVSYALDEDAYAEAEYNDLVRKRFTRAWDSMTEPYRVRWSSFVIFP